MKILFIIPGFENNGPVNMCYELIRSLILSCNDIDISVLGLRDSGERLADFKKICTVYPCARGDLLNIKKIFDLKFDIYHSHCLVSDLYAFLFARGGYKVTTLHNCFDLDFVDRKGFFLGRIQAFFAKKIIKKFYKIACSKAVYDYYSSIEGRCKLIYIQNGSGERREPKEKIYNTEEPLYFFYVGSLISRKNVDFLLNNFSAWSVGKNVFLDIYGAGDMFADLEKKYASQNIAFHGKVDNILDFINSKDCLISASKSEGLPMAIVESLSMAKPFICSNIPSHCEILDSYPEPSGLIFDLASSEDFLHKLDIYYSLNDDRKKSLSKNAYQNYFSNFTGSAMGTKYYNFYKQL